LNIKDKMGRILVSECVLDGKSHNVRKKGLDTKEFEVYFLNRG